MRKLAGKQESRISRKQLLEIGFTGREIDGRVERLQLTVEHRGVHAAGQPPWTLKGALWAAVLACGPGSFVSHLSAAYLDGYLLLPAILESVDITIASGEVRSRAGITVHRACSLTSADVKYADGLPATRAARTMLDLAATAPESVFESAFDEACFRRHLRKAQVDDVLARNAGVKGVGRLRSLWEAGLDNERNRLEAEKRMASLIQAAKLPQPRANAPVAHRRVDFLWPEHKVVVETDGFGIHGRRKSFESDRARDAELQALGYVVMRVTWRQLEREPYAVIARLASILALAASGRPALLA